LRKHDAFAVVYEPSTLREQARIIDYAPVPSFFVKITTKRKQHSSPNSGGSLRKRSETATNS